MTHPTRQQLAARLGGFLEPSDRGVVLVAVDSEVWSFRVAGVEVMDAPTSAALIAREARRNGEAIGRPAPAKSANVASPAYEVEEEPPFTAALASESESERIPASEGTSAPVKAPEVDMGRAEEDELEVPGFLAKRSVTGAVRGHTTTEGW